jgi:hypothetical protein
MRLSETPIDPTCAFHGKRWSEHEGGRCLYCCLCFKTLTYEECHELPDGTREDVCDECAAKESAFSPHLTNQEEEAGA